MKRRGFFAALLGVPMVVKAMRMKRGAKVSVSVNGNGERVGWTPIIITGHLATEEQRRQVAKDLAQIVGSYR